MAGQYRWTVANIGETVSTPSYVVGNLAEGMDYEFRVAAENRAGVGKPSQPSDSITVREHIGKHKPVSSNITFSLGPIKKLVVYHPFDMKN
jgi:hypothetical protein